MELREMKALTTRSISLRCIVGWVRNAVDSTPALITAISIFTLLLATLLTTALLPSQAAAASNHPELNWQVLETEHFRLYHYAAVTEATAFVAEAAEEIYPLLREKYGYDLPLPVRIVFDDTSDPLNGAAYHSYTLMEIEGLSSVTEFRGVHDWLRDVVAHEMAHLFSLRKATMLGDLVPGLIVSGLDAPSNRPFQVAATLFIPSEITPRWFAEGIAQADSASLGLDRWDSHRDMLLRSAFLEKGVFELGEMGALSNKNYLQAEKVYNQGFDFLRYLGEQYGPHIGRSIAEEAGKTFTWNFERPMEKALKAKPGDVFETWKNTRQRQYTSWLERWAGELYEGEPVVEKGFLTRNASVSPNGKWLVFTANGNADYSQGDLYLYDISTATDRQIFTGVGSQPAWSRDNSYLIVSSDSAVLLDAYTVNDLYRIDIPSGKVTQLTKRVRAEDPAISADEKWMTATVGRDGRRNITLWPLEGKKLGVPKTLTHFRPGIEATHPRFSPDGKRIVFSVNVGQSADLWMADITTETLSPLTQGPAEEIEPFFVDATTVAYISDDRSAFDLYTLNLTDRTRRRLTTAVGGAFSPSASAQYYYYALYHDEAFRLYRTDRAPTSAGAVTAPALAPLDEDRFARAQETMTRHFKLPVNTRKYFFDPLPLKFYPEFLYADRSARVGGTLSFSDVLSKHEFELEILLGENQDYHLSYKNHQFTPDFVFDLSRYVRRDRAVRGITVSKLDFTFDGAVAGAIFTYGSNLALALSASARRIDFGYPIDRKLETGYEQSAELNYYDIAPNASADINPTDGRRFTLRAGRNTTQVFTIPTGGSILDGRNKDIDFYAWTAGYNEYIALPGDSTLELGGRAGYLTRDVNPFDQLFLGGRIFFLRQGEFQTETSFPGYQEFAVSGEKLLIGSLAYRFPLWKGYQKLGPLSADSLYLGAFSDAGNVLPFGVPWKEMWQRADVQCAPGILSCTLPQAKVRGLLTDAGAELRFKTLLFDSYPWNSFFRVAYGFQEPKPSDRFRSYLGLGIGF